MAIWMARATELERLQGSKPNHAAVKRLAALLAFSDVVAAYPDVRSLRERAAANPAGSGACSMRSPCISCSAATSSRRYWPGWIYAHHRGYKDDLARRSLVLAFELIGEADPIVARHAAP